VGIEKEPGKQAKRVWGSGTYRKRVKTMETSERNSQELTHTRGVKKKPAKRERKREYEDPRRFAWK